MISSVIDNTAPDMLVRAHLLQTLRPASYKALVSALHHTSLLLLTSRLHPVTNGNRIVKFADDTYMPHLVVPASNSSSRLLEINHIQSKSRHGRLKTI